MQIIDSILFVFAIIIVNGCGSSIRNNDIEKSKLDTIRIKSHGQSIIVPVILNNSTKWFLLDTGAGTAISNELQIEMEYDSSGYVLASDMYKNRASIKEVTIPSLTLGNYDLINVKAGVLNLNKYSNYKCGLKIDGLIGSDILNNFIVQVDYNNKVVIIGEEIDQFDIHDAFKTPITLLFKQNLPVINLGFLNRGNQVYKHKVIFDSGGKFLFYINDELFKDIKRINSFKDFLYDTLKENRSVSALGRDKSDINYEFKLEGVSIGGFIFKNIKGKTINSSNSYIGSNLFSLGIVTIDFINKIFYIKPYISRSFIDFDLDDRGFYLDYVNGKFIVDSVKHNSKAEKVGIYPGLELIKINNNIINNITFCDFILKDWVTEYNYDETLYVFYDSIKMKYITKSIDYK